MDLRLSPPSRDLRAQFQQREALARRLRSELRVEPGMTDYLEAPGSGEVLARVGALYLRLEQGSLQLYCALDGRAGWYAFCGLEELGELLVRTQRLVPPGVQASSFR
ncbi:hypothetical protein HNR42_000284 [Deinobacterium chartae]|uniref:Uncharacterized protein n=1 Tax=Deinobacterium chartae TaxID=521158 RepID=A0A841HY74_9DEIO|nr:hypothetical protein [Deinobacterium chartae]MBB6096872.1 hypothetical protein [Deinobacterium chartae]